jgi:hypothetical protein
MARISSTVISFVIESAAPGCSRKTRALVGVGILYLGERIETSYDFCYPCLLGLLDTIHVILSGLECYYKIQGQC